MEGGLTYDMETQALSDVRVTPGLAVRGILGRSDWGMDHGVATALWATRWR